jgi:UDP-glucose 4-epimerase
MVLGSPSKTRYIYAYTKLIDEFLGLAYYRQRELPVVVGRFFNVVGPRQSGRYGMVIPRFVNQALDGGPVQVHDDGNQVRCFMHVRDTVRAVIGLMHSQQAVAQIFNIGSDEAITIRQLAELVVRLVDNSVKIEHISYGQAFGPGFEDVRCRIPDLTRLRATLHDFAPRYSLADILREVIDSERLKRPKNTTGAG